jgi:hypothetical protein
VDNFRQQLKVEQRKLSTKRMVKGVDFIEPIYTAPFDISEDHVPVMTNEDRAYYDKKIEMGRVRSLSPKTLMRVEDERCVLFFFIFIFISFEKIISSS